MKKIIPIAAVAAAAVLLAVFLLSQKKGPEIPSEEAAVQETAAPVSAAVPAPVKAPEAEPKPATTDTMIDHKAAVFHVYGDIQIQKSGSEEWAELKQGDFIEEKDKVRTGKDAFVQFSYDEFFLNTARLGADSLAEFYSIEPTQVYLRQGEIYNTLDGMPESMEYDVGTHLAVAAIRGTRFVRKYDPSQVADTTLVASGIVEVSIGEAGAGMPVKTFKVEPNQALTFNSGQLAANKNEIDVKELSLEEMDAMNSVFQQTEDSLSEFTGGAEKLQEARAKWKELMKDNAAMAAFKAEASPAIAERKPAGDVDEWRAWAAGEAAKRSGAEEETEAFETAPEDPQAEADAGMPEETPEAGKTDAQPAMTVDELVKRHNPGAAEGEKVWEAPINVCDQRPEDCSEEQKQEFCRRFPNSSQCAGGL